MLLVVTAVWQLPPAAGATATDGAGAASSGWTEQQESRIDSNSKRMKIAGDIACSMCTYIAVRAVSFSTPLPFTLTPIDRISSSFLEHGGLARIPQWAGNDVDR